MASFPYNSVSICQNALSVRGTQERAISRGAASPSSSPSLSLSLFLSHHILSLALSSPPTPIPLTLLLRLFFQVNKLYHTHKLPQLLLIRLLESSVSSSVS